MKALINKLRILTRLTALVLVLFFAYFVIYLYQKKQCVVIGAKNCTEQHLLGEILAQLIEKKTGLKVIRSFNLEGTTICFNALKSGAIDLYFEYTGTALLDILKEPLHSGPLLPYVREKFKKDYSLFWLDPLGFSNQYVLVSRPNTGLTKISDLEGKNLQIAFDPEFSSRQEVDQLKKNYRNSWSHKLMDQVILYLSLEKGGVDLISAFSTDGRLFKKKLVILEDDRNCLPHYEVAPIVSKKIINNFPQVHNLLIDLAGRISVDAISEMNHRVEVRGESPELIAKEFLNML